MIRLAWSLAAADAGEPSEVAEVLTSAELAGVDWSAGNAEAALASGKGLAAANVPIVCLATTLRLPIKLGVDSAWLDPARVWVMAAAELGAETLRLRVSHDPAAKTRPSPVRLADQLAALADFAGQQHVRICIETRDEFAQPAELWRILELGGSKNLSACCSLEENPDAPAALRTNLVSTLNSRIRFVHLQSGSEGSPHVGTTAVLRHLRGIGYDGWMGLQAGPASIVEVARSIRSIITPPKPKTAPAAASKK